MNRGTRDESVKTLPTTVPPKFSRASDSRRPTCEGRIDVKSITRTIVVILGNVDLRVYRNNRAPQTCGDKPRNGKYRFQRSILDSITPLANYLSWFRHDSAIQGARCYQIQKIVKHSDVTYTIPPDTLLMLHARVSSAFTPACLAIVAEPNEVLGRSGLPIRKAAA